MPPENWWGRRGRARRRARDADGVGQVDRRAPNVGARAPEVEHHALDDLLADGYTGLRQAHRLLKIIAMRAPRTGRISRSGGRGGRGLQKTICPRRGPVSWMSRRIESEVTLLPQPDFADDAEGAAAAGSSRTSSTARRAPSSVQTPVTGCAPTGAAQPRRGPYPRAPSPVERRFRRAPVIASTTGGAGARSSAFKSVSERATSSSSARWARTSRNMRRVVGASGRRRSARPSARSSRSEQKPGQRLRAPVHDGTIQPHAAALAQRPAGYLSSRRVRAAPRGSHALAVTGRPRQEVDHPRVLGANRASAQVGGATAHASARARGLQRVAGGRARYRWFTDTPKNATITSRRHAPEEEPRVPRIPETGRHPTFTRGAKNGSPMAGEKKKPDLRSRLNKGASAGATASRPVAPPPVVCRGPDRAAPAFDAPAAPPAVSNIGDDIAVPTSSVNSRPEGPRGGRARGGRAGAPRGRARGGRARGGRAGAASRRSRQTLLPSAVNAGPAGGSPVIDDKGRRRLRGGRRTPAPSSRPYRYGSPSPRATSSAISRRRRARSPTRGAITDIPLRHDATGTAISTLGTRSTAPRPPPACRARRAGAGAAAGRRDCSRSTRASPSGSPRSRRPPLGPTPTPAAWAASSPTSLAKLMKLRSASSRCGGKPAAQALSSGPALTVVRASLADAQRPAPVPAPRGGVQPDPQRGSAPPVMGTPWCRSRRNRTGRSNSRRRCPGAGARQFLTQSGRPRGAGHHRDGDRPGVPHRRPRGHHGVQPQPPWPTFAARLRSLKQHVDQLQRDHRPR